MPIVIDDNDCGGEKTSGRPFEAKKDIKAIALLFHVILCCRNP